MDVDADWIIVLRVLSLGAEAVRLSLALGGRTGAELGLRLDLELRLLLLVILVATSFCSCVLVLTSTFLLLLLAGLLALRPAELEFKLKPKPKLAKRIAKETCFPRPCPRSEAIREGYRAAMRGRTRKSRRREERVVCVSFIMCGDYVRILNLRHGREIHPGKSIIGNYRLSELPPRHDTVSAQ